MEDGCEQNHVGSIRIGTREQIRGHGCKAMRKTLALDVLAGDGTHRRHIHHDALQVPVFEPDLYGDAAGPTSDIQNAVAGRKIDDVRKQLALRSPEGVEPFSETAQTLGVGIQSTECLLGRGTQHLVPAGTEFADRIG
jgi:hypothetical protein